MLNNGPENKFTFTSSVAGIDNFSHGFVFDQFQNGRQLFLPTTTFGFVLERIRNKREPVDGASPIFESVIVVVHVLEFEKVTDGPRDDDVLAVPVCFVFL